MMLRDWLDEYRSHPIPTGAMIFTLAAAVIVFAVTYTIRHTHELPIRPPGTQKNHHTKSTPATIITITQQPAATPTRTITIPPPRPEVTQPGTPHRKKSGPPPSPVGGHTTPPTPTQQPSSQTATAPPTSAEPNPTPTEVTPTSTIPTEPSTTSPDTQNPSGT